MIGVVLCGGQSSRMGEDKAMINTNGISWAQASINTLSRLNIPIYLSVNKLQEDIYSADFDASVLIKDVESLQLYGPLAGVISAHINFPLQDIFVLACDMQSMESEAIIELHKIYTNLPNYDAYVFLQDQQREPLCAIYTAKALKHILSMHTDKLLMKHSMNYMLDHLNVYESSVRTAQKQFFKNYNAPSDLKD